MVNLNDLKKYQNEFRDEISKLYSLIKSKNNIKELDYRLKFKFTKLNFLNNINLNIDLIKSNNVFNSFQKINSNLEKDINKNHDSIKVFNKDEYLGNLTNLISCSQNYYEDLIKIYLDEERVIEVEDSGLLNIYGNGLVYLVIKKDLDLIINYENINFQNGQVKEVNNNNSNSNFLFIKILIEPNIKANIMEISGIRSNNIFKNQIINLSPSSKLNYSQIILGSKLNLNMVKLTEESNYNLKSTYIINNSNLYLENKSFHIGSNSKSNMEINGISKNNSFVINDGRIIIDNLAFNSIAHQKLNNIIFSNTNRVQSDPILEVRNSKVECSHGSSISNIDDEILFYLNSKGIPIESAKELISDGLLEDVISNFSKKSILRFD